MSAESPTEPIRRRTDSAGSGSCPNSGGAASAASDSATDWGAAGVPEVGQEVFGFRLLRLLGRGSFGRVFLATQGELAGRAVALKITPRLGLEFQTLARLQHTNIVPIYSIHHGEAFYGVCMPYFGGTTLATLIKRLQTCPTLPEDGSYFLTTLGTEVALTPMASRSGAGPAGELRKRSYVNAAFWVGARLAAGLAHAHARGVLHCDLKPANVLLTDDGQPMILDFNVSRELGTAGAVSLGLDGGTVPYMAPEQLRERTGGTADLDARADVYSLGVLLFELLTGQLPFGLQKEPQAALAARTGASWRRVRVAGLRGFNPRVSRAAEAVVLACLDPEPDRRYPGAAELHEDLERHLSDRPLAHATDRDPAERVRKWARRNPWATSPGALAAVGVAIAVAAGGAYSHRANQERAAAVETARQAALDQFAASQDPIRHATLALMAPEDGASLAKCLADGLAALAIYGSQYDPDWRERPATQFLPQTQSKALERDLDLLAFLVWRAGGGHPEPPPNAAAGPLLVASNHMHARRDREAVTHLRRATQSRPDDLAAWFALGVCHARLGAHSSAANCFSTCIALQPRCARVHFRRGLALLALNDPAQAEADFARATDLEPTHDESHVRRAEALGELGRHAEAVAELTALLERDAAPTRLHFLRATARRDLGDAAGTAADLAEGLRRKPGDELSWVARGVAQLKTDPNRALMDFAQAERLNPNSVPALRHQAAVLGGRLDDDAAAVGKLDQLLRVIPDDTRARLDRAWCQAKLGRLDPAVHDVRRALADDPTPATWHRAGCILARCSATRPALRDEALKLVGRALARGHGVRTVRTDPDLNPLRADPRFEELTRTAELWSRWDQ